MSDRQALRRFWITITILTGISLVFRLLMLDEFLRENPLAEIPRVDARTYWDMAGTIAAGQWLGETPFLSAPLYPYLLGLVRKCGGSLLAVYIIQLVMHLATGVVVARVVRIRFGVWTAILAAAIFFSMTEPAISVTRVLANTLQLFLAALLWWRWVVLAENVNRWSGTLAVGGLIGLFALAYPAAMLLVPAFGLWMWWQGARRGAAFARAAVGVLAAIVVISPATLHNFLMHGEFIPITAHSGVTLAQGNNPDAKGNITEIPGISMRREEMHLDAASQYQAIHGHEGSWRQIDRHFRSIVINWWRSNPAAALQLIAKKAYYYLTVKNYDDIMSHAIEREAGFADRAILAPVATPWIFGCALVGLIAAFRRPIRNAPELLLALLPLLVVLIFFYSPRYRMPAVPVLCGLSAYAIAYCYRFRLPVWLVVLPFILPLPLAIYNARQGIDSPDRIRAHFLQDLSQAQLQLGDQRLADKRSKDAEARYASAVELWNGNVAAHDSLASIYIRQGRIDDAIREYETVACLQPKHLPAHYRLYNANCLRQNYSAAADALRRAIKAVPGDVQACLTLAWLLATCPDDRVRDGKQALRYAQAIGSTTNADALDIRAAAHAEIGDFTQAVAVAEKALQQARRGGNPQQADLIQQHLEIFRAGKPCRSAPRPIRGRN